MERKVAYMIVGEDLSSPLLRRQVIELLISIKARDQNLKIGIFNFQGFLSIINHFREIRALSKDLKKHGISQWVIPNLCPWPLPNLRFTRTTVGWRPYSIWNRRATRVFSNLATPWMYLFNKILGYQIFHCRSYVATYAAIAYKRKFHSVKVIFDPRSDFPEEGVTAGYWRQNDRDFRFWKDTERLLLEEAETVALISPAYLEHYRKSTSHFRYFYAPNNVDQNFFTRDEVRRDRLRKKLNYPGSRLVFVYLGALTESGWHQPAFYLRFHDLLRKTGLSFEMLFLVPPHCRSFAEKSLSKIEEKKIISPDYEEVADYLSAADFGMMFFHREKIAVGTKIGEYLCTGLPMVVNRNCIGATDYLRQNPSSGVVVGLGLGDLDDLIDVDPGGFDRLHGVDTRVSAVGYFGIDGISDVYIAQYEGV